MTRSEEESAALSEARARGYREGLERAATFIEAERIPNPSPGEQHRWNLDCDTLARAIRAEAATPSPQEVKDDDA